MRDRQLEVYWSNRLEELAGGMFEQWEAGRGGDPFAKTCVVTGDMATRNWLQRHFLLERAPGRRRVLANIDFVPLPEFVNNWLAAMTHEAAVGERRTVEHPYAPGVLAWRINAILKDRADDPELAVLQHYISGKAPEVADRRRYDLSTRLAKLYDDYLGYRYGMLLRWERGEMPSDQEERWQAILYRLLVQEVPGTYPKDFAQALGPGASAETAFRNGFPRYEAVHVFDVATAPWPYLQMLKKLAEATPVAFWNFNPSEEFWLDDPTKREVMREKARRLREALQAGEDPAKEAESPMFDSPKAKLLGSLATGARGVLAAELDLADGDCEWIGAGKPLGKAEVHSCYSPRRELEAARDALHHYFKSNPGAKPSDALVLCADWATYSPLIESVFSTGGGNAIPIALEGGVAEETPITHALEELFDFRTNRFEVSKVLHLLSVPAVREKFGIDADGFAVLRGMVQENNLHWGYDDADVKAILGEGAKDEVYPFTWRRGLDRFVADALLGPREDERALVDLGGIGRLQPCGRVEDDRARAVAGLCAFVAALKKFRDFLRGAHALEEWRDRLVQAVNDFYAGDDETERELAALRKSIGSTIRSAMLAREQGKAASRAEPISGEVMARAVLSAVKSGMHHVNTGGDCVRFAPLRNGTAVPAKFVWICGLNDGAFPHVEYAPAFDLIGRHLTLFDVTARERDNLALLKAAAGARERLAFSYTGQSVKTDEELPPSVALADLMEWFKLKTPTYVHPLQAYSPRYYREGGKNLPLSYSATNRAAAEALETKAPDGGPQGLLVRPFEYEKEGETVIELDDLIDFYCRPCHFLAKKRLHARISKPWYDNLSDEDAMGVAVPAEFKSNALLDGAVPGDEEVRTEAERLTEEGAACEMKMAEDKLALAVDSNAVCAFHERRIDFAKTDPEYMRYACPDEDVPRRYREYLRGEPEMGEVRLETVETMADGSSAPRMVRLTFSHLPAVGLANAGGKSMPHVFVYKQDTLYPQDRCRAWIRHLALQATDKECVTALFSPGEKTIKTYRPVPKDEAVAKLRRLVEKATEEFSADLDWEKGAEKLPEEYAALTDGDAYCYFKGKKNKKG